MTETAETLDADLKQIVDELEECRATLALSDASFARNHLRYDAGTYSKIKAGKYHQSKRVLDSLRTSLRNLREVVAKRRRGLMDGRPFFPQDGQARAVNAVRECLGIPSQNRLIMYLAPTGGGKSALVAELRKQFDCVVCEATEAWRDSYHACCTDVALAAGQTGPWRSKHDVQASMLAALSRGAQVLIVDEGNYFGPQAINMLKLILNRTPSVVVIPAQPVLYDRMISSRKTWAEAAQLARRAHLVIRNERIQPRDLKPFFSKFDMNGEAAPVLAYVAKQANIFGLYDLVWRTVDQLDAEEDDDALTLDRITKAVERALDDLGRLQVG